MESFFGFETELLAADGCFIHQPAFGVSEYDHPFIVVDFGQFFGGYRAKLVETQEYDPLVNGFHLMGGTLVDDDCPSLGGDQILTGDPCQSIRKLLFWSHSRDESPL